MKKWGEKSLDLKHLCKICAAFQVFIFSLLCRDYQNGFQREKGAAYLQRGLALSVVWDDGSAPSSLAVLLCALLMVKTEKSSWAASLEALS